MADTRAARLRRLWLNVHLLIGAGLAALLVPISLSGAILVWHDELDVWSIRSAMRSPARRSRTANLHLSGQGSGSRRERSSEFARRYPALPGSRLARARHHARTKS